MQTEYFFGRFRLIPTSRLLLEGNRVVELGSRAFDLLLCLVRRSGEVVTTSELMSLVWPWTVIEAGNVRVQISALRKALGDDGGAQRFIVTIPHTGYGFAAEVTRTDRPSLAQSGAQAIGQARAPFGTVSGIPPLPESIVGREKSVDDLATALLEHRCVAVVGPGGVGKTVVATLLARRLSESEGLPVTFVSLAAVVGAADALSVVASALGSPENMRQTFKEIRNLTRNRRMLLVLDNCEHVIEFAAQLAEQVLRAACEVRILAASREPLGVRGARVIRLDAMEAPAAYRSMTLEEAKSYSAINLFVQRAAACLGSVPLCDDDVPAISEICRRLDGNPLAIELAAANLDAMDVQKIRSDLSPSFAMLRTGNRQAESRHQTFEANLDWSFDLLSTRERDVLRDIGVFSGSFSAEAAFAVTRERDNVG
jgi:DNA-binding winged helix-turn-helix (wHTH) protein